MLLKSSPRWSPILHEKRCTDLAIHELQQKRDKRDRKTHFAWTASPATPQDQLKFNLLFPAPG